MPEEEYVWLPHEALLTFEELAELAAVFASLGATKIRLTGGEPLVRRDLPELVRLLARVPGVDDLALTTNGVLLEEHAAALRAAGLDRLNVSLDTLRPERFRALTGRDLHSRVLAGLDAARAAGLAPLKLDAVVMRGVNDDELCDLVDFARDAGVEARFIEYMDVGGATRWSPGDVVSRGEILARLAARFGTPEPLEATRAPAQRYRLPDGVTFGVIASTTAPFCRACDRSRLTADGMWLTCLYATDGVDLRRALRGGASREALAALVTSTWSGRRDRGAEERLATEGRGPLVTLGDLRRDPHLEMHTRGG